MGCLAKLTLNRVVGPRLAPAHTTFSLIIHDKNFDQTQIVDQHSATLGLAGHREEAIAIEADHRRICKFDDPKNSNYEQVRDNIVRLAKKAVRKAQYGPMSGFRRDSAITDF